MCGITGIIGRLDPTNRAALERMNDAMLHRGPDANGIWTSAADDRGWGALLAHGCRLKHLRPHSTIHPHMTGANASPLLPHQQRQPQP